MGGRRPPVVACQGCGARVVAWAAPQHCASCGGKAAAAGAGRGGNGIMVLQGGRLVEYEPPAEETALFLARLSASIDLYRRSVARVQDEERQA